MISVPKDLLFMPDFERLARVGLLDAPGVTRWSATDPRFAASARAPVSFTASAWRARDPTPVSGPHQCASGLVPPAGRLADGVQNGET
jgi:hypothetical protein